MPADVGQPAPELGLYDFDRQVRNLADHRGQTWLASPRLHRRLHYRDVQLQYQRQVYGIASTPFSLNLGRSEQLTPAA